MTRDPTEHLAALNAWRAVPLAEQSAIMAERAGAAPVRKVVIQGLADGSTGYGQMCASQGEALDRAGVPVAFEGYGHDESQRPVSAFFRANHVAYPQLGPKLYISGPSTIVNPGSILSTMWEQTRLPPGSAEVCNRAACVVVPCEDNARWFRESGVTVPIRVVPLGIDTAVYFPDGPEPEAFTVGCAGRVGAQGDRKRLGAMARLFVEAFPRGTFPDVRLRIKCWDGCEFPVPEDDRISVDREALTDEGLAGWYRSLSVFASASLGEGWGLQPHQAMACGRPCIAPFWGGHRQYMTEASCWPVEFDEPLHCHVREGSMVSRLREAYADRPGRLARGEAAAVRAAEFTWERSGRELAAVVREFGLDVASANRARATPAIDPQVIKRVNECEHRGPEGGLALTEDERSCCGGGAERTECRAGKGARPGRVTLRECLACAGHLG